MRTLKMAKRVLTSALVRNIVGIIVVLSLLVWGEIPGAAIVNGTGLAIWHYAHLHGPSLFLAVWAAGALALTLCGVALSMLAAWFMKPKDTPPDSQTSGWAHWKERYIDRWLERGGLVSFVLASYMGGATVVAGWCAARRKRHAFLKGVCAGIVLAIPSAYTWALPYRLSLAWTWPIPWLVILGLAVVATVLYGCRMIILNVLYSTYHCNIRVTESYRREIARLYDPEDMLPYRLYVVRRGDRSRKHLWKMGVRVEEQVFWENDGNTPLALFLAAWRYLTTTVMVVLVDQRPDEYDGQPRNFAFGMMRLTWGSSRRLVTLGALAKKPWFIRDVPALLEANGMPIDAGYYGDSMDLTMIAVLKEYRGDKKSRGEYYDKNVNVLLGLLAQTCQLAQDHNARWWFTILNKLAFRTIRIATKVWWTDFKGVSEPDDDNWLPYFGSKKSKPFWCDFQGWAAWLLGAYPDVYRDLFEDGLSETFHFEPRKTTHGSLTLVV